MIKRLALAVALGLWSFGAQAQGLPPHTVPIGEGLTSQGWGIGGPCSSNQTLVWAGPLSDPTCSTPSATAALSIGTATITGGLTNAILDVFNLLGSPVLSQIVPFPNEVVITNAGSLPHLSTTLPSGITHPNPMVTGQYSGANTIPLSSLLKLSGLAVVGNNSTSAGNVGAPWAVANSIDGIIPLIHPVPTLTSGDAVCLNDTVGTLKDCGTALGTAAAQNIGVSGGVLGLLNAALHWSGIDEFSAGVNFTATPNGGVKILSNPIAFPPLSDSVPGLAFGAIWTGPNTFAHVAITWNTITSGATTGSPYSISTTTDFAICLFKGTGSASQINLPTTHATGDTYLVKDCKGDDATNNITVTTTNGDLIETSGTTKVLNTSTTGNFDRLQFTWTGNASIGWAIN